MKNIIKSRMPILSALLVAAMTFAPMSCGKDDPEQKEEEKKEEQEEKKEEEKIELGPVVGTDLGADGTSNCYIISKAGEYSFACYKGNSTATSDYLSNASRADVLWCTDNTGVAPEASSMITDVNYSQGRISFKTVTPVKNGNVVIA
ncbi:MAG: hypothetical protein K5984_00040, partial [Bacteroidales bacterium]|nr:hypothetical protein [Bacteroidales bacterium]